MELCTGMWQPVVRVVTSNKIQKNPFNVYIWLKFQATVTTDCLPLSHWLSHSSDCRKQTPWREKGKVFCWVALEVAQEPASGAGRRGQEGLGMCAWRQRGHRGHKVDGLKLLYKSRLNFGPLFSFYGLSTVTISSCLICGYSLSGGVWSPVSLLVQPVFLYNQDLFLTAKSWNNWVEHQ